MIFAPRKGFQNYYIFRTAERNSRYGEQLMGCQIIQDCFSISYRKVNFKVDYIIKETFFTRRVSAIGVNGRFYLLGFRPFHEEIIFILFIFIKMFYFYFQ